MIAALVLCLPGCVWSPPAPDSVGRTIAFQADDTTIPVEVNGKLQRLRISGGGLGGVILNPDAAARSGIRGSAVELTLGSERVRGGGSLAALRFEAWAGNQRVSWFDRPVEPTADGSISLSRLPYDRVTLYFHLPSANENDHRFATESTFLADVNYIQDVAGEKVTIRFELDREHSTASAAAGALLARHHEGSWAGEPGLVPIAFGIERPGRPMRFAKPLSLNGLRIKQLLIRTSDYGGTSPLPTDMVDENEIVVQGGRGARRPRFIIALGRDILSSCSTLIYERATRQMVLSCASGSEP